MPFAPVSPRAVRGAESVSISFMRRGRIESDAWEPPEIPLGEDFERYRIEIARPSGGPRVIETATPSALYAAVDLAADFSHVPDALDLVIAQVSASVGAGFRLSVHLPIQ